MSGNSSPIPRLRTATNCSVPNCSPLSLPVLSCSVGDAVPRLLCRDGFREIIGRVAADSGVHAILDTAERRPECAPENWVESPTRCDASQSLLAFVDDPERFMAGKIGLMLHQMWRVEQARRQAGEPAWTNVATQIGRASPRSFPITRP